jgi:hypothetical protein
MDIRLPVVINLPPMPNPADFAGVGYSKGGGLAYQQALQAWERAVETIASAVKSGQMVTPSAADK